MDNNSHPLPHRTMQHRRGELTGRDLRLAQFAFERGAAGEEFVHFGDDARFHCCSLVVPQFTTERSTAITS